MDGVVSFEIAGRRIGAGERCFIIAEAGVNHDGDLAEAIRLVDAAARAGADAVKFQTFRADTLVTADAPLATYQKAGRDAADTQLAMLKALELSETHHRELVRICDARGIVFLSSPFDEQAADLLDSLGVPAFKVASGEITNVPLLVHVARKRKPIILSTGMSTLDEVHSAVAVLRATSDAPLALLHCVSRYPASADEVNLRAMHTMAAEFGVPVGYSDHTIGEAVPLAAVALGACVIEKHLTMDRGRTGPDHRASMEPPEFATLVSNVRSVESALGNGRKEPAASEAEIAAVARKSLVATRDIPEGSVITSQVLACRRPGTGLPPAMQHQVVGRTARTRIAAGTLLTLEMLR